MKTELTARGLRKTGISIVGEVRWGTHFCYFYETKQDLLDMLVPYFKEGLENKEFCLWVVAPSLTVEDAKRALGQAVPDLDCRVAEGSLEIHGYDEWYFYNGQCDPQRVLERWREKLNETLAAEYVGLRASGDTGWIQNDDWMTFREYENQLNALISDHRMIILCTYPLTTSPANQVFDVTGVHHMAVARRDGRWEMIETPNLKQAKAEIKRLNDELEQKVEERTRELAAANEELKLQIIERKEAERQSRALIDAIPQQIWSGLPNGTLDYCNDRWRSYMGITLESLQGNGWQTMLHPDERDRVLKAWHDSVVNGTPYEQEERHRGADGTYRWFLARGVPARDTEGRIVRWYGTNTDIEEHKRAEAALNAHALRYKTLMETSTDSIYVIDEKGNLQEANAAFLLRRGYTKVEAKGLNITDWDAQWSSEQLQENLRQLVGSSSVFETQHRCKDGSIFDVEVCATSIKINGTALIFCVTRDITERKQAEDQLRRSEEKFKAFFDIAPVGIIVLDRQHNIVDANSAVQQITRLSMEELLSGIWQRRTYLNADGTRMLPNEMASERAMTENRPYNNIETGIVLESGEIIWTQVSAAPLALPDASAVVITQDITERKRAAKELEVANLQLRLLSRRLFEVQEEERRHLARELHDEVGQTLTAAKLNLKIIAPEVSPAIAGRLKDSIEILDRLLMQVRQLSLDLRPPLLDDLGLVPALRWLVDQQTQRARVHVTFSANVERLELDPSMQTACFRVAQEAITNAIRHARAVTVAVELQAEPDCVRLLVQDDGVGFDKEAMQERAARGESIGLLSMNERVSLLGGELKVNSTPGRGTQIRAWFPLALPGPDIII